MYSAHNKVPSRSFLPFLSLPLDSRILDVFAFAFCFVSVIHILFKTTSLIHSYRGVPQDLIFPILFPL